MSAIKQFFTEHAKLGAPRNAKFANPVNVKKHYPTERYHVVNVPEAIESPVIKETVINGPRPVLNLWSPWVAKTKVKSIPPAGETKYTLDLEMDAFNLWSPWATKTNASKAI